MKRLELTIKYALQHMVPTVLYLHISVPTVVAEFERTSLL